MTGDAQGTQGGRVATGSTPDPYPAELVCTVEGRDGAVFDLRPIRSDDGGRLVEFHAGLSTQSVYRRFFFVHPRLTAAEVEKFTHVDYKDRLALVATDGDRLIAVGRYERLPETVEAEVAFVVADEFQHRGLATLLLEHLASAALEHGITTFVAETLAENQDMIDVFTKSGFHVSARNGARDGDHAVPDRARRRVPIGLRGPPPPAGGGPPR